MNANELEKTLSEYLLELSHLEKPLSDYQLQEKQICEHLLLLLNKLEQGILFPANTKLLLYDGLNTNSIPYLSTLQFLNNNPDKIAR